MLSELEGRGWVVAEPPEPMDDESVIARVDGEKIRRGLRVETIEDRDDLIHERYRTGKFDLDVKVDFDIGRGQVKVERADGYED
jgi:hypothetical protein